MLPALLLLAAHAATVPILAMSPPPFATPFVPMTGATNMNGEYSISVTPAGRQNSTPAFAKSYANYPNGTRFFDVYSPPFQTLYSQVWWAGLPPVPLPEDVIDRYKDGRTMAIVGFECDQVMRTTDAGDVSVPISAAYNHHFTVQLNSKKKSDLVKLGAGDSRLGELRLRMGGHGVPRSPYIAVEHTPGLNGAPTSLMFGGGNGGEYRKTFHGYPPGFVHIIDSPSEIQFTPMQIDTWHRDAMDLKNATMPFVAGPLPRNSAAPAGAAYSGLLECPLTTRITKDIEAGYSVLASGACQHSIQTAAECFTAALKALGASAAAFGGANYSVVASDDVPAGCSMHIVNAPADADGDGDADADGDETLPGVRIVFNERSTSDVACAAGASTLTGSVIAAAGLSNVTVHVSLDLRAGRAELIVAGPAAAWFGVGFNASAMKDDDPWTLIVSGSGRVSEYALGDHALGRLLAPSVNVESSVVAAGSRRVVLSRPLNGSAFSFDPAQTELPIIVAVGSSGTVAYHKAKTSSRLVLLPLGAGDDDDDVTGACVCAEAPSPFGQGRGSLRYTPVRSDPGERGEATSIEFNNMCAPQPRGDLLAQKNPTCDVRAYTGGQIACHHMFSLLDADQPIPWPDRPMNYTLKWRIWYQDFDPQAHTRVRYSHLGQYTDWSIGAGPMAPGFGAEYDVPRCGPRVAGCSFDRDLDCWVHTITGAFKIRGPGKAVVAHLHCHAPTCLSMAVYNNASGKLLCEEVAVYGKGRAGVQWDEPGFIAVPPCMWGHPEDGLEPPLDVENMTLRVVKRTNATFGHHGEMAHGEIFYVY